MQWTLHSTDATDVHMGTDPKTGEPTLSLQGEIDTSFVRLDVKVSTPLSREAALSLRDQIDALYGVPTGPIAR